MGGIYGDMLAYFPELMRVYYNFTMEPLASGGYEERSTPVKIKGILAFVRSGRIVMENDTISSTDRPFFWSRRKLTPATFISDTLSLDGKIYRICEDSDWTYEGGFYPYELQTVTGNTDTQVEDTDIQTNVQSDY